MNKRSYSPFFIAHRGNLNGPSKDENKLEYLQYTIEKGFYVEADLWLENDTFFLGHDEPQYEVKFLELCKISSSTYFHCKNISAVFYLTGRRAAWKSGFKFFWHQNDDITITSDGYLWTYPGIKLTSHSIAVMPETTDYFEGELFQAYGICTDYPIDYKERYDEYIRGNDGEG